MNEHPAISLRFEGGLLGHRQEHEMHRAPPLRRARFLP
jgi:hypothetical protein